MPLASREVEVTDLCTPAVVHAVGDPAVVANNHALC